MRPRLIALFPNEKKASSIKIAKEICHFLKSQQIEVTCEERVAQQIDAIALSEVEKNQIDFKNEFKMSLNIFFEFSMSLK